MTGGLCHCGCGNPAPLAARTDAKRGYVRGEPLRFVNGHQRRGAGTVGPPGERYVRLVIQTEAPPTWTSGKRVRHVLCRCDCGGQVVVKLASLRGGLTKSCGCLERERIAAAQAAIGERFGRLIVCETLPARSFQTANARQVRCVCECGQFVDVLVCHLRAGATTSCGCKVRKHGHAGHDPGRTRTYITWMSMRQRCNDANQAAYALYGGRGIKVCARWESSFANFLADMGERPEGTTIDRIDNDHGYEPVNCRWADAVTQRRNRRDYIAAQDQRMQMPRVPGPGGISP